MTNSNASNKSIDDSAIFIGGHSRSGTTLIQGQICKSPETIEVTKECSYFRALIEAYELGVRWYGTHTDDYFDDIEALTEFHRQLLQPYFSLVSQRFGPNGRIVQKEPRLTPYFAELAHLLPNAKFIFMVRDIRDIIASQTTRYARTGNVLDVMSEINRFVATYKRIHDSRQILRDRILFVRYEALTCRPIKTLKLVFNFLDLSWTNDMEETSWPTKRQSVDESGSELDGVPITPSSVGRYRTILSQTLIEEFEREKQSMTEAVGLDCYFESEMAKQDYACTFTYDEKDFDLTPGDEVLAAAPTERAVAV